MKKLIPALALALAAVGTPAFAADIGLSITIGDPRFYGQLDVGEVGRPRIINSAPVLVERRYSNLAPVYLRVPPEHARNWRRYCDRYNACTRPVYFVRDDWYRNVYAPRYREMHHRGFERREERRDDRRDERRDDRRDDDRDRDRGHDHGHDRDRHRD